MHLKIYGQVQGVGFRTFVRKHAEQLQLDGWAKNLPDGTIEVVARGTKERLLALKQLCEEGPQFAQVEKVKEKWEEIS